MEDSRITLTIGKQKNIALIAHDGKKAEMIEWCAKHKDYGREYQRPINQIQCQAGQQHCASRGARAFCH